MEDVEFPSLANPMMDNRGLTEWTEITGHAGSVITKQGTVLPKDQWAAKKIDGGCFRLAVVPVSATEAGVYLQFIPMPFDEISDESQTTGIMIESSSLVAIRMGKCGSIALAPSEMPPMKASLGLLPFIFVNGSTANAKLPSTAELREEMAGTLRGVSVPLPTGAADLDKRRNEVDWPPASAPEILWPAPTRTQAGVNARELSQ